MRSRPCRNFLHTWSDKACSTSIERCTTVHKCLSGRKGERTMETITVANYLNWGKLVKTWATGRSYFEDDFPSIGIDKLPIPRSIDELKAQMLLVNAGVFIPPNVVGLAVVQYAADTMV